MLTDYHVHLHESKGITLDWLKEYVEVARQRGIGDLGISEHAYFFQETKEILVNDWANRRRSLHFQDYLALFEAAEKEKIPVKMGIEMDYVPGKEREIEEFISRYPFDYVIGSVHWIGDWGIDLAAYRDEYEKRDIYGVYRAYFDQVVTLAESRLFQFVGHIDLVKIFNYRPTDQAFLEGEYDRVVRALSRSGTSIEISTAGLRKPVGEIYPDPLLLKKCFEAGVTIVLSSDAHEPQHVGYEYGKAVELARSVGYTEVQVFTRKKKSAYPLG
ncbi:Histidinol-phosphatase [[Clostridium] ultunense Esp]|nr:Histidinol-phosphatase [[Clostridium] ultunense Esp]